LEKKIELTLSLGISRANDFDLADSIFTLANARTVHQKNM